MAKLKAPFIGAFLGFSEDFLMKNKKNVRIFYPLYDESTPGDSYVGELVAWDRNKYVTVCVSGTQFSVKLGYVFCDDERFSSVSDSVLASLPYEAQSAAPSRKQMARELKERRFSKVVWKIYPNDMKRPVKEFSTFESALHYFSMAQYACSLVFYFFNKSMSSMKTCAHRNCNEVCFFTDSRDRFILSARQIRLSDKALFGTKLH